MILDPRGSIDYAESGGDRPTLVPGSHSTGAAWHPVSWLRRLLAVMNRTRSPIAPHVPTAAEAGYPDLTFDGVTGFFGWRGMPAELRNRIAADVRTVADNAAVRERLARIGIVARSSTPAEFAAAIEEQRRKVAMIAATIGTKPTD